ncbi:glycoside hydrolase family 18 protein [Streptomyces sp. NBC_01304]|uniref:glycoside hydrolase family 18 protein n=1 Tax=Streptomyces sp. NBC_01304 TaxID=2903818 RepID=UPI002E11A3CA|nr:glycoside hydrolase family 18 protein [Streptomyces sp. NBC_01304]
MRRRLLPKAAAAACFLSLLAPIAPVATAQDHPASQSTQDHGGNQIKRVGYFTQWGVYGRDFQVQDLDKSGAAGRLTHINYAFGNVSPQGTCFLNSVPGESDPWADYIRPLDAENSVDGVADTDTQALAGNFNQLKELKAKHPGLKVMISLGGWSWSTHFSDAVRTPASRKALVESCVDLYLKGNLPVDGIRGGAGAGAGVFDGVDLDWEWPGSEGDTDTKFRPEDKQNFTALVDEFRDQLDALGKKNRKHYDLSAFVPAAESKIDAGFEVRKIMKDLDFVNLQGYDFHVSGEKTTAQQSALFAKNDFSVHRNVQAWLNRGAPARKLVVGMPFYGQGWTGISGGGDGMGQPAGAPAPAKWANGYADYKELKALAASGTYKIHRNVREGHTWLFDGTTLWTYDDPATLALKSAYVKAHGLGGAMFWSLDGDTPDGELVRTVDRALGR